MLASTPALFGTLITLAFSTSSLALPTQKRIISNSNLTPDGYWHNRYHALLAMAAYGDWNTTCPTQTFTEASKLKNFPNSTRPPWDVISTFGPTPSGCQGFTVIVPEMNKAVIVFKGNLELEHKLPLDVQSWDALNVTTCPGCTVNSFALKGYLECKVETNNWEAIRAAYAGQGLVFSITGHGLGGQHSLIASVDLNNQNIDYYSHNYGTPRTFNTAGANWINSRLNGEAAERGIYGDDTYTEFIPAGPNYAHAGTPFYYSGLDPLTQGPKYVGCWDANSPTGPIIDDPGCFPTPQVNSTAAEDHLFYFSNVGQCGGKNILDPTIIDAFLTSPAALWNASAASTNLPPQPGATGTSAGASGTGGAKKGSAGGAVVLQRGAIGGAVAGLVVAGTILLLT